MRILLAVLLVARAACSSPTTSTELSNRPAVAGDTSSMASNPVIVDTTYTETLDLSSAFTAPQIESRVAYVYNTSGLDAFADAMGLQKIGHVDYGEMVELNEPLINNVPYDTMTISGLKGHFAGMSFEGRQACVFSGYLLNLPVPTTGQNITEYFSKYLHLTKPAVRTTRECDCDGVGSQATYEFENGIVVNENGYYEGYDNNVRFNNTITLQEVYLFATYFYECLAQHVQEFPMGPSRRKKAVVSR